jgi:hemerythrin
MGSMQWTSSNAVFITEIDDEHQEIFEAVSSLQDALAGAGREEISTRLRHLGTAIAGHFAHEERLMRAARYGSFRWHKRAHDAARKRVGQYALRIEQGDPAAGSELTGYLATWLHDHTGLADRMMGAFLRNQQRGMCKLTFRAGTKPAEGRTWVRADGTVFDPLPRESKTGKIH